MDMLEAVILDSLVVSGPSVELTKKIFPSAGATENRPTLMSVLEVTWKRPTVVIDEVGSGLTLSGVWDLWTVFSGLERDDGDEEEDDDDDVVEEGVMEEDETTTTGSGTVPGSWSLATETWNVDRG